MTNYREVLRLYDQGLSQRSIASSCGCSKSTVQRAIALVKEHGLTFPLASEFTNERLTKLICGPDGYGAGKKSAYKEPDYAHIHKEMAKSGVKLTLLWSEYCSVCAVKMVIFRTCTLLFVADIAITSCTPRLRCI